jgi:pantoate--beta-alanine ligase
MAHSTPQIVRETDQLRRLLRGWRDTGDTIALVPLFGELHQGHSGVLEAARRHAAHVVVGVSSNNDSAIAQAAQLDRSICDLVFAPGAAQTSTHLHGADFGLGNQDALDARTTQVARMFGQVQPNIAVLGERDWVQLVAIRQMVRDLALPVGIVSAATVREKDQLAISSRNTVLTPQQRVIAPTLNKVLTACAGLIAQGGPVGQVVDATRKVLSESGFSSVDYVAARRAHDLAPIPNFDPAKPARLFAAVRLGTVQLTDSVPITRAV